jgi:hypothetical protein
LDGLVMEKKTFAPAYVAVYPMLAEIAGNHGYSMAVHGSVGKNAWSDLDLIACPWRDECSTPDELMDAVAEFFVGSMNVKLVDSMQGLKAEVKPHGRLAYRIPLGHGSCIDISVMPSTRIGR